MRRSVRASFLLVAVLCGMALLWRTFFKKNNHYTAEELADLVIEGKKKILSNWEQTQKFIKIGDTIILLETKDSMDHGPKIHIHKIKVKKMLQDKAIAGLAINGHPGVELANIYFKHGNCWINLDWFLKNGEYHNLERINWDDGNRDDFPDLGLDLVQPSSEIIYFDKKGNIQYPTWIANGKLGERPIVFSLMKSEKEISGCYFFVDQDGPQKNEKRCGASSAHVFSGKQEENGSIQLVEIVPGSDENIQFEGQIIGEREIEGIWSDSHGKKSMTVSLIRPILDFSGLYWGDPGLFRLERLCNGKYLYHQGGSNFYNIPSGQEYFSEGYPCSDGTINCLLGEYGDFSILKLLSNKKLSILDAHGNINYFKKNDKARIDVKRNI